MAELIAVVSDPAGRRYELVLRADDSVADAFDHGDVRERLMHLLNREATRAATVLFVADKDQQEARQMAQRAPAKQSKRGPAQVAFAGSDESLELDKDGNEVARTKGGKRTVTRKGKQ